MKRILAILATVAAVLMLSSPALAASLGISPSRVEVSVPGDGSATTDVQVHYFSGDVAVSLVDIPLRVEPEILHVDALNEPADIQLTIYGDDSLGSQVYNGYIKFVGMSGDVVAIAVQVRAKVTNIVEGQPIPESPAEEPLPEESSSAEPVTKEPEHLLPPRPTSESGGIMGLPLNIVIIVAAGIVFVGLVIFSISIFVRKNRY